MFAGTITPENLHRVFEPVDALVKESRFHISSDGISVTAVDSSNVGMVDLRLPSDVFETYEAQDTTIGVPLDRFLEIVSVFKSNSENVRLYLDAETRTLRMESDGLDYTLSLIDPKSIRKEPQLPDLDLTASISLDGDVLQRVIKACNMISNQITLGVEDGEFLIKSSGDTDSVYQTFSESDDGVTNFQTDADNAESLFSIEYVQNINRVLPEDKPVMVEAGDEFPAIIRFNALDDSAPVMFVVAPRIASD